MNQPLSNIKAAILDMDGVIWKSHQPLCDLKLLFKEFKRHQINFLFATNNAMSTVEQYVEKFASMGTVVEPWQILTSSIATGYMLAKDFPNGGPIHVMGSPALETTLAEYQFTNTDKDPIAVVGGLDPLTSYERLKKASLFIQSGIPFYFTNPDATYPTPEGLCPGAGTFLAALETASGVKAKLAGKPFPYVFEAGLERLKFPAQQTLVIGDRLETDILGGYRAGCKTALVLSGVATRADLESWSPAPDVVLENVMDLFDLME
ncbi:MAG: HAD-IIA family hydrolase [Chloroflexi bacterium]|nr:HAD-IIA family hydrolase [Chloroflexota bacterium]